MQRSLMLGIRVTLLGLVIFGLIASLPAFGVGTPMQKKSASDDVRGDVEGNDGSIEMAAREAALPPKHERKDWWSLDKGPFYGTIGQEGLDRNDRALIYSRAGTFRLDSSLFDRLPQRLRRDLSLVGTKGGAHAYVVALPTEETYRNGSIRKQLEAQGFELVDFLAKEAVVLRVKAQDIRRVQESRLFDYVDAYHPALKIEPMLGRVAFWDKDRAESEIFSLRVMSHRGEDLDKLTARIERLGGNVLHQVEIGGRGFFEVDLHFSKVFDLADLGAVASIEERREYRVLNTVGPSIMQTGRWNRGATPFFDAGIDGGGETRCVGPGANGTLETSVIAGDRLSGNGNWILGSGDNDCDTLAVAAGSDDVLMNTGDPLVAPQVICTADNGASLDAAGLAHSTTEPCLGGDCTASGSSMGATVGGEHRKVQSYTTGLATDPTSSGDLTNCDSAASGAGSHGNQVANILVGNPSNGIDGLGITRDDNDQDTNNEFDERFLPLDGEARGARLIFQDISITTTGSGNPCNQLPAAVGPGANFVDQGNVVPGSIAQRLVDCAGASIVVFPFGVPNFDNVREFDFDTGHYLSGAVDIDAHMWENRAQAIFLPTGNDGADPFDGNDIYPDDPGHPACGGDTPAPGCPFDLVATRIQVNHLATAKNATTVGSSRADTIDFFGNFDETENYTNFTSKGPATFESRRVAPMVMGQGSDLGTSPSAKLLFDNLFNSDVVLKSSDNDNAGVVEGVIDEGINGTSFSASHVAGGAALIHDYFAQGAYPTGAPTLSDRQPTVSGALTRALVVASGNFMTAFTNGLTRWNNEQGTGRVELSNVMPLANFHGGPVAGDPRRALRPNDGGTPATIPTIPTSLLVFDEFFEGGNTWSKNGTPIATGLAVLEEGGTLESTFTVVEASEQLRISLSWYDPASALDSGGLLINDLDLTVVSPSNQVYRGNNFLGEFSVHTGQGGTAIDTENPVETVILNRPVKLGTWTIRVKTSDPSVMGANNAVCTLGGSCGGDDVLVNGNCTSGSNGVCESTGGVELVSSGSAPLPFGLAIAGGHLGSGRSAARLDSGTYDCSDDLNFTILETSVGANRDSVNAATTLRVVRNGSTVDEEAGAWDPAVQFAILKTGANFTTFDPISVQGSSSPVTNNGILEVQSGDRIELTYVDGAPAATITASAVVDCEARIDMAIFGTTGLNHQFIVTGGCDVPFGGTFTQGDIHFDAGENIIYQMAFMNSSTNTIPSLTATLTCIDPDPSDAVNPCDVLSPLPQTVAIGDFANIPPNRTLGVVATAVSFNLRVAADLTTQIPLSSDRVVKLRTTLGSSSTDTLVDQVTFTFSHALHADDERLHYSTDHPQGTQACDSVSSNAGDRCLTDADCTGGQCVGYFVAVDFNRDGKIDTDLVNREVLSFAPLYYDVSTGLANRNITTGNSLTEPAVVGNPQFLDADGPDDVFGHQCFSGSTPVGPACASDADCGGGQTCRTDDPVPWNMDGILVSGSGFTHGDSGATGMWKSFENPLSDPGFPTPTEIWSNGGGGACGFQSQDRGGSIHRRAGVWHAGNAAASPSLTDCADYPTPLNAATPEGVEFIKWALISPILQKVNTTTDARGFEFTVSMERTAWNENVLLFDTSVYVISNLDNDLRTATNVSADQDPQQKDDFNALFVSEAYVNTAIQGPVTRLAQGQNRFGGAREVAGISVFSRLDPDNSLGGGSPFLTGDEVGVARTIGGPRTQQVVNVCQDPFTPCPDYADPIILASLPHPMLDSIGGGQFDENDDWLDLVNGTVLCGPNKRADTAAAGGDTQIITSGTNCSDATGIVVLGATGVLSPQTLAAAQQSLVSGPVRNNEQDQTGYEDTFGASTDKFQFAFQWMIIEGAVGSMGFTADDIVWEWDETHPTDQVSAANSCADICIGGSNNGEPCSTGCAGGECSEGAGLAGRINEPGNCVDRCVGGDLNGSACTPGDAGDPCIIEDGTCPDAGSCVTGDAQFCGGDANDCISAANQCATISVDRLTLLDCNTPILVTVQDLSEGTSSQVDTVVINVRSDTEPFGEEFFLTETSADSHIFQGFVPISSTFNSPGVIFTVPSGETNVVASYKDPDCDLDGFDEELLQVGQLGENDFNDVDGDGVDNLGADGIANSRVTGTFDDDNCFNATATANRPVGTDSFNPSQADSDTFCLDVDGSSSGVFCAAGEGATGDAFCVANAPAGFGTCRGDRVGDACDNCPDDFNPGQEDSDVDGVGNVCELDYKPALDCQDTDDDGICNTADNCPTVANSGQQDGDSNGVGDLCDGAGDADGDTIPDGADNCPGLPNFQQQDADGDGIGDACEAAFEDFDGDSVLDILDNCPLAFNPQDALGIQSDIDEDGQGDACDVDSDDDNDDGVPDDLLQFFMIAQCNLSLGTVSILAVDVLDGGDADGFADEGETIVLNITVRNNASDSTGAPLDLTNVVIGISSSSPSVACVLDATAVYGDLPSGADKQNPAGDQFSFVVQTSQLDVCNEFSTNAGVVCTPADGPTFCVQDAGALPEIAACGASPSAQTLALTDIRTATFAVTVSADQIAGQASATSFTLTLDLDIIGDTSGGGPLGGTGQMCEDFEDIEDPDGVGIGVNATSRLTETFSGHRGPISQVVLATDIIPVVDGTNCSNSPIGPSDCSVNSTVNDWHLHSFAQEPDNAPGGSQAHGGDKSLHMGRHLNPNNPQNTTYRFRQLTAFMSPPINIALSGNRALEFWHIARMADDNAINFQSGQAGDYGIVQLRLDQDSDPGVDDFGPWLRIEAVTNPYDHLRDDNFTSSCKFDPLDDFFDASAGGVTNETMCFPNPGFSNQGEFTGTGASIAGEPCIDADSNGHVDCGSATTLGPGSTEIGSIGTGVWIRTRFDLGGFLGRRAQIRWIFSSIAFGNLPAALSYNETPSNPGAFDISERDDGWLIDDICITGLLTNQLNLIIDGGDDVYDSGSGTITCGANLLAETFAEGDDTQTHSISPAGGANICSSASDIVVTIVGTNNTVATDKCATNPTDFCTTAIAIVNGEPSPSSFSTLAAGQAFVLNAGASSLDACTGGSIQYQFSACDTLSGSCNATVLKDFSSSSTHQVSPMVATRYAVSVRCSSVGICDGGTENGNTCDVGNPNPCQSSGGVCAPGGCDSTALATVFPVDPGQCGLINIGLDCGGGGLCSGAGSVDISFTKPGPAGVGIDVDRGTAGQLATPITTLGTAISNGLLSADAPGAAVTLTDATAFGGSLDYYLVSCDYAGPKSSGNQRIGGAPTARFQNP